MICIYHSRDLDGWMSAAIIKLKYPKVELIGWDYGQPIPDMSFKEVIMVDISFPKEVMIDNKNRLTWIDHHASAITDIGDVGSEIEGERNSSFAACELAWKYFFRDKPMPELVRLLGRYDCFGHKQLWMPVVGYEELYEVSNHGNVRSLDRIITENNTGVKRPIKGKRLSAAISKRGYLVVVLCNNGTEKMFNVHNLVATSFIKNDQFKPTVNHKDLNRLNNYITNLEWATYEENNLHAIKNGVRGSSIIQFNDNDELIAKYSSIIEAGKETGIQAQNIGKVCKGERNNAGGFRWKYGVDKEKTPQFIVPSEEQKVLEFQYGARSVISNPDDAYSFLIECTRTKESEYWFLQAQIVVGSIHEFGRGIYKYLCSEAKQTYAKRFTVMFDTYKFAMVNQERFNPINFGIDYHKDGYDGFACAWYQKGKWMYSLYNDDGKVDCSDICKSRGGGGHKGASGFQSDIFLTE